MGAKEMVFRAWAHKWAPYNSQCLVLKISGADFPCCWVIGSLWLEHAESSITKQ